MEGTIGLFEPGGKPKLLKDSISAANPTDWLLFFTSAVIKTKHNREDNSTLEKGVMAGYSIHGNSIPTKKNKQP